tara:strand:- start:255 stop:554 length:300 start_codon:yes stop_codon:yes gene_type:complete
MLVVLAILEIYLYNIYISPGEPIKEINRSSLINIPRFFNFVFRYLLPFLLVLLLGSWVISDLNSNNSLILQNDIWTILSRISLIIVFLGLIKIIRRSSQ